MDSQIKNVVPIEKLIKDACSTNLIDNQVHMFGLGGKASLKFIEKCAQLGKGNAYNLSDNNLHDLRYMIIDALYRSS